MTKERIENFPADDFRKNAKEFQEPNLTRNLALAKKLKEIGGRHGLTAGAAAVAWTLNQKAVTGAIVGARRPDQVDETVKAGDFRLSPEEIKEIESEFDKISARYVEGV